MTPTPAKQRVEWVDLAKGLTITLVVLLHAVGMLTRFDLAPEFWNGINGFVQPIRMPLFFVASGLFAQGMLRMTWATMLRSRVAHLFYLYTVWLLVFFVAHNLLPDPVAHGGYAKFSTVISGLVAPSSALWFIYGLAVFAIVAKAISRFPLAVQFGFAIALSISAYGSHFIFADLGFGWRNLGSYFVYFLLAVHAKPIIVKFSHLANGPRLLLALGAYAAVYVPIMVLNIVPLPELRLVVTTVGLLLGVLVASALVGTRAGNIFQKIGKRTLPVYVMMDILIALVVFAFIKASVVTSLPAVTVVAPLIVTALVVSGALALHTVLVRFGMNFLFELHPAIRGTAKKA
ncbi:acyltransferase family protein [Hoyosella rhizosphaerae]|nr:acyltransferase family protein [Hoyosella rhizosphaerae]